MAESKKKYSVLVIDDQANWRELLVNLLEDEFDVKSASNHDDALEIIRNQIPPFHVVVTDMRLKDEEVGNEDGLKLVEYLNKRGDETKMIVVTGYATIDTARKALSLLAAYDYLEKRPSDGSPFAIEKFRKIVHHAAEEVEQKRPQGFIDVSYDVLVLEPNQIKRSRLQDVLQKDGYRVTGMESIDGLENSPSKDYVLILINESLATGGAFDKLQRLYPNGKIIILTLSTVHKIIEAMREHPVLTVVSVPNEEFNDKDLREILHSALSRKYISAQINHLNEPEQLVAKGVTGKTYHVNLSIQDNPSENAVGINLLPQGNKRGKIKLHVYIQANGMKVAPEVERYWNIPLSTERPEPCSFLVTPEKSGRNDIVVEIDQENRWLGRIQMKLDVES